MHALYGRRIDDGNVAVRKTFTTDARVSLRNIDADRLEAIWQVQQVGAVAASDVGNPSIRKPPVHAVHEFVTLSLE